VPLDTDKTFAGGFAEGEAELRPGNGSDNCFGDPKGISPEGEATGEAPVTMSSTVLMKWDCPRTRFTPSGFSILTACNASVPDMVAPERDGIPR
jgi:hypothetical protein